MGDDVSHEIEDETDTRGIHYASRRTPPIRILHSHTTPGGPPRPINKLRQQDGPYLLRSLSTNIHTVKYSRTRANVRQSRGGVRRSSCVAPGASGRGNQNAI